MRIALKDTAGFEAVLIRQGLTKKAFAKRAGVSAQMLTLLSTGKRTPSPQTAKKIVDALDAEFDDLFQIIS